MEKKRNFTVIIYGCELAGAKATNVNEQNFHESRRLWAIKNCHLFNQILNRKLKTNIGRQIVGQKQIEGTLNAINEECKCGRQPISPIFLKQ